MVLNTQDDNKPDLTERLTSLINNLSDEKKEQLLEILLEWQRREQRQDTRIPCLIAVDYSTSERFYRDFIQDLSNGGVFIETREPLQVGQNLSLTFSIPNTQSNFKISGKIVRAEENGIAVQFDKKLSGYQKQIIQSAISKKP